jgi:predicted PhzF superfamily epimerase YddE/YHI9
MLEQEILAFQPDFAALAELGGRGVIITAPSDKNELDFVSRCFYPNVGVPEDPVTGSAHCTLACWWAERLNKAELTGYQASSRGGTVRLALRGDRVHIFGQAITIASGELHV